MKLQDSFFALLCLFLCSTAFAQTSANSNLVIKGVPAELPEIHDEDWSIYVDEETQTYFIDFEKLSVNLNDIVVRKDNGEVVMREEVFNLPVNTIYELDFSNYARGSYTIELRSFTGVLRREVKLAD